MQLHDKYISDRVSHNIDDTKRNVDKRNNVGGNNFKLLYQFKSRVCLLDLFILDLDLFFFLSFLES